MWSRKARGVLAGAIAAVFLSVVTAQWFLLALGLALGVQLAYARATFHAQARLAARRELDLDQLQEGDAVDVASTVENEGTRTQFLEVREVLPRQLDVVDGQAFTPAALGPGDEARLTPTLEAPLMGRYEVGPLEARREDPFAFFFEEQAVRASNALTVLPRPATSGEAPLLVDEFQSFMGEYPVNRPGDGFDFYGLREYVPGDTYRMINWKASARTDDVMVDQFERTTSTEVTFLVDGRAVTDVGPEHETPYVRAARAIVELLDKAFDERNEPRFVLYGDGLETIQPGAPDRMRQEVLEALAAWEPSGDQPLAYAIEKVLPRIAPGSAIVVVSPLLDDPTVMDAVATALAHEYGTTVVAPPVREVPGVSQAEEEALLAARERTVQGLRGFGVDVSQREHMGLLEVSA